MSHRSTSALLLVTLILAGACSGGSEDDPSAEGSGGVTSNGGVGGAGDDTAVGGRGGALGGSSGVGGSSAVGGASGWAGGSGASGAGDGGGNAAGAAGDGGAAGSGAGPTIRLPPADAPFDYQIGGGYPPPEGVRVVSRDRQDSPAPGLYNICYVNGFQAQPHEATWWQTNHPELVLRDAGGQPVVDGAWNELLLDVSTAAKRQALAAIMEPWIEQCAADGFDAVEVDNLDSYSRSQGLLAEEHNVLFMGMLSAIAHRHGLASAQKNTTEFLDRAARMGTDFAIAESCNTWSECGDYQTVYGDLVFVIEYNDADFATGCRDFSELSIVRRDRDVTTPGSATYVYDGC